jgi:glycopeptide antibiotics resistance protein
VNRAWALFGAYLIVLLTLTFFPFDGFHGTDPVDLRLQVFRTIHFALKKGLGSREFTVLIGNLAAFVPLGLLLPQMIRRRSLLLVVLAGLALSVAIEAGQLAVSIALGFAYRTADIDDVIVNVAGAVLGYVIYIAVTTIWTRAASAGSGSG